MTNEYDIVIIGGGPTGLNCAIAAHKANLSCVVLEKGVLVNSIYNFPINMTFFSTSPVLEIGGVPFISHGDKPTRSEAMEYYRRIVGSFHINIKLYEEVTGMERKDSSYIVTTKKQKYRSKYVIVATGYYDTPRFIGVPGENLPKVKHYYDDPHLYIGMKVIVVGAANSACDAALECYYKGADVTMVIREGKLYKGVKYWILPNIENRIKEGSIKAHFNSSIIEIKKTSVIIKTPEGVLELPNDFVLAMTGYLPNYFFLENLGLQISRDEECVPSFKENSLESNLQNVYVAGVICAGTKTNKLFIENTREHGKMIVDDILKKESAQVQNLL